MKKMKFTKNEKVIEITKNMRRRRARIVSNFGENMREKEPKRRKLSG